MGRRDATEGAFRVDVAPVDPDGEVQGHPPVVDADHSDGLARYHAVPGGGASLGEVGVRGHEPPTVVDRHRRVADDHPAERHTTVGRGMDLGVRGGHDVDPPVAGPASGRGESPNDVPDDRPGEAGARRRMERERQEGEDDEVLHDGSPPSPREHHTRRPSAWEGCRPVSATLAWTARDRSRAGERTRRPDAVELETRNAPLGTCEPWVRSAAR
jgi:hypothetical protein